MKAVNATASFVLAIVLALTAAVVVAAAVEAPPSLMSRADRLEAMKAIERDARLALAACREIADDTGRALCRAESRAQRRVAIAMLDARYLGTILARQHVQQVQSRASHSVGCARRMLHT